MHSVTSHNGQAPLAAEQRSAERRDRRRRGAQGERRCLVRGQPADRDALIRFVVDPDGVLHLDLAEKLPGRGYWLTASPSAIADALKKRVFDRAARRSVTVPENLAELIEQNLRRRCCDALGLAMRAGTVTLGFERIAAALPKTDKALILRAADSGERNFNRLRRLAPPDTRFLTALNGAEMASALGKTGSLATVMIAPGKLADRLARDHRRLAAFAPQVPPLSHHAKTQTQRSDYE